MNQQIADMLNNLGSIQQNQYKKKAYKNAARNILDAAPITRENVHAVSQIDGVGEAITNKVVKFVLTGIVPDQLKGYSEIIQLPHFGPKMATNLVNRGISSVDAIKKAVREGKLELTEGQAAAIKYYKDLLERIPRAEVKKIGDKVSKIIKKQDGDWPGAQCNIEIVGSYRRGATSSGDVDILVSGLRVNARDVLTRIANKMDAVYREIGSQKATLWVPGEGGKVRQVDVFCATTEEYVPYLLYSTGSAQHNEKMRALCKQHGWRLNQLALLDANGNKIPLTEERTLYDLLDIPYVPPSKREK